MEDIINDTKEFNALKEIASFFEYNSLHKVINKLTDYAEIINDGKLSGLVNFNYNLNSTQTNKIIDFLVNTRLISNVKTLALKGSSDLNNEYVSNIVSDTTNPENISSYVSLRTLIENRLTHQIQQYNVNMSKNNSTQSMPINELRGHVRTVRELQNSNVTVSHKAHHGTIAASLHDAYITIMTRVDWWEDKSYIKYFFNEDDSLKRGEYILTKKKRKSLIEIESDIKEILEYFLELKSLKIASQKAESKKILEKTLPSANDESKMNITFTDKMLHTPFGQSYGIQIDRVLRSIFNFENINKEEFEDKMKIELPQLYDSFLLSKDNLRHNLDKNTLKNLAHNFLTIDYGIKVFAEKFLHKKKVDPLSKFYTAETKVNIEEFISTIFILYFEEEFSQIFKIIRSKNMKQFACAFILKRIYLMHSDELTTFGYYFIQAIATLGKIKM